MSTIPTPHLQSKPSVHKPTGLTNKVPLRLPVLPEPIKFSRALHTSPVSKREQLFTTMADLEPSHVIRRLLDVEKQGEGREGMGHGVKVPAG